MRLLLGVVLLAGCGAGPATTSAADPAEPAASSVAPASRETSECQAEREAILADVERSAARPCRGDGDCVTVTNPGSAVPEHDLVAHVDDAPALDARAEAHRSACGAFIHHEAIDAIAVISASCHASCRRDETVLHVE